MDINTPILDRLSVVFSFFQRALHLCRRVVRVIGSVSKSHAGARGHHVKQPRTS